jgi:hypothetical protein
MLYCGCSIVGGIRWYWRATLLDKQLDGPTHKDYRVQAALQDNFDLRRYPFDGHDLSIALEHKLLSTSELVYVPDRQHSGVAPDVVVTGWQLHPGWDAQVGERYFPTTGKRYSDFAFRVSIQRAALASVLKTLLPSLIITLSGLLALLVHAPEKAQVRTAAVASALVGVVLFHLNMTSSIPPIGYLTFADRFSLINYLVLFGALVSSVWMLIEDSRKGRDRDLIVTQTALISHRFLIVIPVLWVVLHGFNLIID